MAQFVRGAADLRRCQALRHRCFVLDAGGAPRVGGLEQDGFDGACDHVMVQDQSGDLVCCFRVMYLGSGADIHMSYSAQSYDLEGLSDFAAPMIELGRFCVDPGVRDPDVVRIAWGMLAAVVDRCGAQLLFGCSSFAGTDGARYGAAFDLLAARHQGPAAYMPRVKSAQTLAFVQSARPVADHAAAMAQVPALLKTYLSMGGWVSDHAVIDPELNTLHVFTGLEIAAIPAARAKALRAIAGG